MTDLPIKATLKAGRDFSDPWVTVDANDPSDLQFKLEALINGEALAKVVEAANALQAANNAAPLAPQGQEAHPQQAAPAAPAAPQGWNNSPAEAVPSWAAQSAQPQQQAAPAAPAAPRSKFAGPPHPEGKTCEICPNVLEFKKTSTGKGTWRCPDWRWNGGQPNGHSSEFAD